MTQDWFKDVLVCPDCGNDFRASSKGIACSACEFENKGRDLRPQKRRALSIGLPRAQHVEPEETLRHISTSRPRITYNGPSALRDSRALMSAISARITAPARVLDLGCGPRDQQGPIEHMGHSYIGVDYSSEKAHFLADAHALPFRSNSFACVLSYAVLEHLHNPFVAVTEIERVLTDGGVYVGTVSQGEPFHQSYFHHTAWGFLSLLAATRHLRPVQLWAANDTLRALSSMGRYSRVIRFLLGWLDKANTAFPFLTPRKMRWPVKEREIDAIHRAGSIAFVVQKVSDARQGVQADSPASGGSAG